jgi:Spy/CpxP family protein refolding chaperone
MKFYQISLIVIACSLITTVALAEPICNPNQPLTQRNRFNSAEESGRLLNNLDLTDEQKEQLAEIRQKYLAEMSEQQENLINEQKNLTQMMVGNQSEENLRKKHEEVLKIRQNLSNLRFESMLEMRQVLTEEQRNDLVEMIQEDGNYFRKGFAFPSNGRGRFNP